MKKSTNRTTKNEVRSDLGGLDWFHTSLPSKQTGLLIRNGAIEVFIQSMWPASIGYFSALNPIFVGDQQEFILMNRSDIWFLKDGIVPLMWFFKNHPKPKNFKSRLLVHEALASLVPAAWRHLTGTYRIDQVEPSSSFQRQGFLVVGKLMESNLSIAGLTRQVDAFIESLGTNRIKNGEILFFLPGGHGLSSKYYAECMVKLCNAFGPKISVLDWEQFESRESYKGFELLEINEKIFYADSFLMHLPLSKGATLHRSKTEETKMRAGETALRLSKYHQVIYNQNFLKSDVSDSSQLATRKLSKIDLYFKKIEGEPTQGNLPWPAWFPQWCRSVVSSIE